MTNTLAFFAGEFVFCKYSQARPSLVSNVRLGFLLKTNALAYFVAASVKTLRKGLMVWVPVHGLSEDVRDQLDDLPVTVGRLAVGQARQRRRRLKPARRSCKTFPAVI
jgi:hypothetical protein